MRTIKFRAWNPYDKWIYGLINWVSEEMNDVCMIVKDDKNQTEHYFRGDLNTLGQFTGLHDKNGNEIYEGDNIILHQFLFDGGEYENQLIGQVIYDDNQACYCLTNIKNEQVQEYMGFKDDYTNFQKETVPIILFYGMHEESFEVIGNIHEADHA